MFYELQAFWLEIDYDDIIAAAQQSAKLPWFTFMFSVVCTLVHQICLLATSIPRCSWYLSFLMIFVGWIFFNDSDELDACLTREMEVPLLWSFWMWEKNPWPWPVTRRRRRKHSSKRGEFGGNSGKNIVNEVNKVTIWQNVLDGLWWFMHVEWCQ